MQISVFQAPAANFDTLDSLYATSVAVGFAFALLLVLTSGRTPRLGFIRLPKTGRIRRFGPIKNSRTAMWQSVPGAIPVGIGSFLIGVGLSGLALRNVSVDLGTRVFVSGAVGTLFATAFLLFVARFLGGGAREEEGCALIGVIARVSLEIPLDGSGRISFEQGGRRGTMPARGHDGRALPRGSAAFVVGVEAGTALVEEL